MKSEDSSSRLRGPKFSTLNFCEAELLDLKAHSAYDEAWLERLLCDRPNLLGLGDVKVVSCQRRLTKGGRLDMIAENSKLQQAFVIEIMLGQLHESHIIRALQYCLRERARPDRKDWEIAAVLVAERVLGTRYRGVVQLLTEKLSMTMPIIVLELSALRLRRFLTLKITRVFDGTEEVPSEATTNTGDQKTIRAEWITKASPESIELAEQFGPLLKTIDNSLSLTYKQEFIGIAAGNRPENFFVIHPKKQFVDGLQPIEQRLLTHAIVDRGYAEHVAPGNSRGSVRETNMGRRSKHQMRILCGDPSIDWDRVKDMHNVTPYLDQRDAWYAHVVKDEVLAKHHRALLIMGAMHFLRNSPHPSVEPSIESKLRKAGAETYLIVFGTNTPSECCEVDHRFDSWPTPSVVAARGWVGELPARALIEGGYPYSKPKLRDGADALLYLGPRDSLISVSMTRAQLEGTAYGKEIERRLKIEMILQADEVPHFAEKEEEAQFPPP